MPGSGNRLLASAAHRTTRPLISALLVLFLASCSSGYQGRECSGQRQTLSGEPLGALQGLIIDRVTSFSVTLPEMTLDSGPLWSADRQLYIPSATTRNGWLAQRLSDQRFSIINAPQNQMITFSCPAPAAL